MQATSNPKCILPRQFAKNFHFPLCHQTESYFLSGKKVVLPVQIYNFVAEIKKQKIVLKNSSVKNCCGSVNIHEKSTRNLNQTHAARESFTFFHWLTLVGFRVLYWNNLLLHQIKQNLSKQRAKAACSCISFQCLWMPLFTSH